MQASLISVQEIMNLRHRQTASSDINGRNITIINYMDSNNFKEYSTDVMPQANGSDRLFRI